MNDEYAVAPEFALTEYGFRWGALKVTRLFSNRRRGTVTAELSTPKMNLQVYVTKTGKIRIHADGCEWKPARKEGST